MQSIGASWKLSQEKFDETIEMWGKIMSWEKFTKGELAKFYVTMGMIPKDHFIWKTWLEFTQNKRIKMAERRKEERKKEFEERKKDNVTNEGIFCTICLMGMLKVDDMRGEDNIIILSKEFLRRDPKDNKKEAYGYYWEYTISQRDDPELFLEVKQSKAIFFRSM